MDATKVAIMRSIDEVVEAAVLNIADDETDDVDVSRIQTSAFGYAVLDLVLRTRCDVSDETKCDLHAPVKQLKDDLEAFMASEDPVEQCDLQSYIFRNALAIVDLVVARSLA